MSKETLIEELKVKWGCSRDAAEELFDAGSASRDAEIESLRQQLSAATSQRDGLNHLCEFNERTMGRLQQQLADSHKQIVMLRDALHHLWNERTPDSYDEAGAALTATADLDGLILCDAEEVAFFYEHAVTKETVLSRILDDECAERGWKTTLLYRAWEPK